MSQLLPNSTPVHCFPAGDLGGYLGLLIGGSVLTLVEVIDLVFYNAALKVFWKR
jgi:hypothetical protein